MIHAGAISLDRTYPRAHATPPQVRAICVASAVLVMWSCDSSQAEPQGQIQPPPSAPGLSIGGIAVHAAGRFAPPPDALIAGGVHGSCVPFPDQPAITEAGGVTLPVGLAVIVYVGIPELYVAAQLPWMQPASSDAGGLSPIPFCAHQPVSYSLPVIIQPFLAEKKGRYSITFAINPGFHAFDPSSNPQLPPPETIILPVTVQ